MKSLKGKYFAEAVVAHRRLIIFLTVLATLGAAVGLTRLAVSNDTRIFFSEENPQLRALEAIENTYNKVDNVLFAVAPRDGGSIFTRQTLTALEELTEAAWQLPYSNRVDSLTNFQFTRAADDELLVYDLVSDAARLSDQELRLIEKNALADPRLVNLLVSASGRATGVNVNILRPGKSPSEVAEVAAYARQLAKEFRGKYPHLEIYLSGAVMIDNAFAEAGIYDMKHLVPLMLLVLLLLIGAALGSLSAIVATSLVIVFSTLIAMGLAGWLGITLSAASVSAPTLILTLAVADSVHLLATMFQQLRRGVPQKAAIVEALRVNLQPVFLTSVTTAIGFLSMNFSDAPPFRDLGNIVAMGVAIAFCLSIFFLPALMAVLPLRALRPGSTSDRPGCDRLADFVIKRRKLLLPAGVIITALLAAGNARIEFNDDFVEYFDQKLEIRRATDFVEKNLRGLDIIEYSLESGGPGAIAEPRYLENVAAFTDWYRAQPQVAHVSTFSDTMKMLNKNLHGDDPAYYRVPESRELAAQYLLLYEMSLPFGRDLNNTINVDKSSTRMIVFFKDMTSRGLREMDARARAWLRANAPSMFTHGSGLSIIWAHISKRNINNMLVAAIVALLLISCILMPALRSARLGLISLFPNLAPALIGFGIWGLWKGRVGLGLSVVVAMTLGIVVDDTIHFISKYLRARREHGQGPDEAVRHAFRTVGTAMWITTLSLTAGFLVLTLSSYRMNAEMGMLTALTISLALALDYLFLPVLLMRFDVEGRGN